MDSELTKPKRGRKKKTDTKMNDVDENDVREKKERLVACVLSGNSLAHKSNFAGHVIVTTGMRRMHFPHPCFFSEMELEPTAG